jgi:hypothetical protein
VQCNSREKVLLDSHQLVGPASDWWDAYMDAHEEPESISWQEFKTAFRAHHAPQGVIKLKKEFQDLKQRSITVSEYVTHFMQLSRYTPNDVDTDEKKQECFLNGLNDGLAYALEAHDSENFQVMVNKALVLGNRRGILERKAQAGAPESTKQWLQTPFWFFVCWTHFMPRAAECSTDASTNWTRICHPSTLDDSSSKRPPNSRH